MLLLIWRGVAQVGRTCHSCANGGGTCRLDDVVVVVVVVAVCFVFASTRNSFDPSIDTSTGFSKG